MSLLGRIGAIPDIAKVIAPEKSEGTSHQQNQDSNFDIIGNMLAGLAGGEQKTDETAETGTTNTADANNQSENANALQQIAELISQLFQGNNANQGDQTAQNDAQKKKLEFLS